MPSLPHTQYRSIDVDADFLPYPATKLVVTQYLETGQDPPFLAWIAVAAFFDRNDQIVWSTELFVALLDIDFESDDDDDSEEELSEGQDVSDSSSEEEQEESYGSDFEEFEDQQTSSVRQQPPETRQDLSFPDPANIYSSNPPLFWDPTRQGPVPGYWQASFDQSARRWVHTWQPLR